MKNPSARQLASTSPCQRTSRPEDADARNGQSAPRLLRTHRGQAYHTATCSLTADSASPQSFADKRRCGFRRPVVLHKNDAIHSNAAATSASRSDSGTMSSLHNEAAIPRPIASAHSLETRNRVWPGSSSELDIDADNPAALAHACEPNTRTRCSRGVSACGSAGFSTLPSGIWAASRQESGGWNADRTFSSMSGL